MHVRHERHRHRGAATTATAQHDDGRGERNGERRGERL